MNSIRDKPVSHGDILKKAWKHLDLGTLDRNTRFTRRFSARWLRVVRVVVLRRFWRRPPRPAFHTHTGAPKIEQIKVNPNIYRLFYHVEEKLQVRIQRKGEIHTDDDLAEEQSEATAPFSRRCYIGDAPTNISKKPTSGLPEEIQDREPTREESGIGRAGFAVISTKIEMIDCLEPDFQGNRRSLFVRNENGELKRKWRTP